MKEVVKWRCWILILVSVLLLSGCGYKDIDKRYFVVSIGVDKAKNSSRRYLISLKFAIPATKDKPSDFTIVSAKADSMSEAVRVIKTKVDREIDFSHAKVLVFSEELVKEKKNAGIYYWFVRRRDVQEIAFVALSKKTALDVLKIKPKSEQLPSNALILALGKDGSETPYIISEFLFDFKKRLIERGLDPMLPIIEPKKGTFEINTVGIFNKSRLRLTLNAEETKYLNHILNRENKGALWVKKGKEKFIVDIQNIKSTYKIYTPKGKNPYIKVVIKLQGMMEETTIRVTNEQLADYEKAAEKQIEKDVESLLRTIQKANLDPVGFGLRYRSRHFSSNDWKEWKRIYPTISFKVNAKVDIKDTGLIE